MTRPSPLVDVWVAGGSRGTKRSCPWPILDHWTVRKGKPWRLRDLEAPDMVTATKDGVLVPNW